MTTIVALHKPGFGTVIGSDRMITQSGIKSYLPTGKWVISGRWAIGVAGLFKSLTIFQREGDALFRDAESEYQCCDVIELLFKENDYVRSEDCAAVSYGQGFLLASATGVWALDGTLAPVPVSADTVVAEGSGCELAMGSGFSTSKIKDPVARVAEAVAAASEYDTNTGGEPWVAALRQKSGRSARN